ncbi:SusC/RagA family TonB-linked outer membrane protein [Larkinella bovis]|uniref:SusC/RagA family TonB-linked outer membrane protein n=1 Tax=Larkinella bovis TaxID=683041 RepID=A0ABW0ID30_9BACT
MKKNYFFMGGFLCLLIILSPTISAAQTVAFHQKWQGGVKFQELQSELRTVHQILKDLETNHSIFFMFHSEKIKTIQVQYRPVTGESVQKTLERVLKAGGLTYKRHGKIYAIFPDDMDDKSIREFRRKASQPGGPPSGLQKTPPIAPPNEPTMEPVDPAGNQAIDQTVTGVVLDETNQALPGVSVVLKGTSRGTTTDAQGKFQLAVPDVVAVLIFSYVGYESQEVTISNQTALTISLVLNNKSLNEVVVVGYGSVKKRDLTGSVASIGAAEIKAQPVSGLNQALQGRVSGVQVTQASNSAGGGVQIRIRGGNSISASNDPLYVIDGFPVTNPSPASGANNSNAFPNVLATLNPNDIESMEVLKDASATAIYGSRGANGVVLITTKRGKEGQTNIEFETYYSVSRITKFHELVNASESLKMKNEQLVNLGRTERYGTDPAYGTKKPDDYLPGTDWQRSIYRDAPTKNYQLTLSGGNDKLRYLVSGNYFDQDGIIITNNFKRYSARLNLDAKLTERIKVGTNFTMTRSDNHLVTESSSTSPVRAALLKTPAQMIYNPDGSYTLDFLGMQGLPNPIAVLKTSTNTLQSDRVLGTLFGEFRLAEGLTGRVSAGTDIINSRRNVFFTPQTQIASSVNGYGSVGNAVNTNILNENTLSYNRTIGTDHAFDLLAGITFQKNKEVRNYSEAQDFPNYSLGAGNLGLGNKLLAPSGSIAEWGLASYLGRLNYRLKDRYLFTVTGRIDGSSRFGANNKYGFFPSGAFAWRVSDEAFLRNNATISDLKVRVSYGLTGNDGIGLYNSLSQYGTGRMVLNDREQLYIEASRMANSDLRWEKTAQFDVGFDLGLLGNRLQITADYYVKTTSDLLLGVELPSTTGFTSVLRNIGSVENRGFELGINSTNLNRGGFKWSTMGNISFNKNKVLKLADADQYFVGGESEVIVKVGEPLGSFYGTVFDGIWQTADEIKAAGSLAITNALPGAPRFKDVNGDGVYNQSTDRTILGNGLPKFIFGLTNNFSYKGFDLSIFLQGVQGNKIFNHTFRDLVGGDPGGNKLRVYAEGAWRANKPSNTYYALRQWDLGVNSFYVEDGSFMRLKNVSLSYQLPLKTKFIKRVRVYVSGQNLLTFTRYKGYDPEVNSDFNSNTLYGFDRFAYPASRTLTLGGNFTF